MVSTRSKELLKGVGAGAEAEASAALATITDEIKKLGEPASQPAAGAGKDTVVRVRAELLRGTGGR